MIVSPLREHRIFYHRQNHRSRSARHQGQQLNGLILHLFSKPKKKTAPGQGNAWNIWKEKVRKSERGWEEPFQNGQFPALQLEPRFCWPCQAELLQLAEQAEVMAALGQLPGRNIANCIWAWEHQPAQQIRECDLHTTAQRCCPQKMTSREKGVQWEGRILIKILLLIGHLRGAHSKRHFLADNLISR